MDIKEEWRAIKGYEGKYEVSNKGRIKSLPKIIKNMNGGECYSKEKILKTHTKKDGYVVVNLYDCKKQKLCLIHRLVAQAFIPNPNNYPIINHKDENPSNNHVENLEWCTHEYNMNYGTIKERNSMNHKGEKHHLYGKHRSQKVREKISKSKKGKLKGKDSPVSRKVICVTTGEVFDSMTEASIKKQTRLTSIYSCCKGLYKSAGKLEDGTKLVWEYI